MNDNQLTIKFGGEGNIKIETLTEFLDQYKHILYQINEELGYQSDDMILEVSPPENGSFKINLNPKYKDLLLNKIGDLSVGVLLGLLAIYTAARDDIKTKEDVIEIIQENQIKGNDVPNVVYNIYNNCTVVEEFKQSFVTVNNDENITDLKIEHNSNEIINIPKDNFSNIIDDLSIEKKLEEISKTKTLKDEATLIIKTIHFEGKAKWAFVFRGYPIKASIKDETFIKRLSKESFCKGDILDVILSRELTYDEDLNTFIVDQSSYSIEQVIKHKSRGDNQNSLNFE